MAKEVRNVTAAVVGVKVREIPREKVVIRVQVFSHQDALRRGRGDTVFPVAAVDVPRDQMHKLMERERKTGITEKATSTNMAAFQNIWLSVAEDYCANVSASKTANPAVVEMFGAAVVLQPAANTSANSSGDVSARGSGGAGSVGSSAAAAGKSAISPTSARTASVKPGFQRPGSVSQSSVSNPNSSVFFSPGNSANNSVSGAAAGKSAQTAVQPSVTPATVMKQFSLIHPITGDAVDSLASLLTLAPTVSQTVHGIRRRAERFGGKTGFPNFPDDPGCAGEPLLYAYRATVKDLIELHSKKTRGSITAGSGAAAVAAAAAAAAAAGGGASAGGPGVPNLRRRASIGATAAVVPPPTADADVFSLATAANLQRQRQLDAWKQDGTVVIPVDVVQIGRAHV